MSTGPTQKRLALLTSGGDAPGMNACIRSVVRTAAHHGYDTIGFERGFRGLLSGESVSLGPRSVSNILQRGGTILHTARCGEMKTDGGLRQAAETLERLSVDALLVMGGDGSLRGTFELARHWDRQLVGIPATIDNDLAGTDFTIGFDTAVNTALTAIDKVRDTAEAHERFFLVEVMGRQSGFIALCVGITAGAEEVLLPGEPVEVEEICDRLCAGKSRGKTSSIIVVAEGACDGGAYAVAEELKSLSGNEYRVCVLGHLQRGGSPTAADRLLASKLGAYAVQSVHRGKSGVMVGEVGGELMLAPLEFTWTSEKEPPQILKTLSKILAT